jgi:ribonuclease HII
MKQQRGHRRMRQQPLLKAVPPDLTHFENLLRARGVAAIAGVDEAGRGCLAGPVVAAAVILPADFELAGLTDSKKLSPVVRERFFDAIAAHATAFSIRSVDAAEIDRINILRASLVAMRLAVEGLSVTPEHLLIDGPYGIEQALPQLPIIKGDCRSLSIAAASVMAKVARDRMMCDYEARYPAFRFSIHKGYGTELHYQELAAHGPTAIHRLTFKGVKST